VDADQLLQMLLQLLTQMPQVPAGNVPDGLPPTGSPLAARELSEEQRMMAMLNQLAQQIQMQQSAQQMQNGSQGGLGAMFGQMGGRPPGS